MPAVEAILAVLGAAFVLLVVMAAFSAENSETVHVQEDLAAPYREGLHAAVRMQKVAADLEQQIYAEAAQRMGGGEEEAG